MLRHRINQWANPLIRFLLIDGDAEIAPGIELVATSGHVAGHQLLLIRLPKTGPVLLTVDAILNSSMTDADRRGTDLSADDDDAEARSSTRKLMTLARQQGVSLIIFGHDSKQWPVLKHAPDYYE